MQDLAKEQDLCLDWYRQGLSYAAIGTKVGLSPDQVYRRLNAAKKRERLDPEIAARLAAEGVQDLAGLHSGWLLNKDPASGSGSSLYFYLGPDAEKISFADAIRGVLHEIPHLPALPRPSRGRGLQGAAETSGRDFASWVMLADLHVGAGYQAGDTRLEEEFNARIDDLVARMPPAEKAVLFELGDLLDANDHKGVTPGSGNPLDVRRDALLQTTQTAIRMLRRAILRLAETHEQVEVHLIPGNHDTTSYLAVMLALEAHFGANPRVLIHVPASEEAEDFRVISWGECAVFPHHGHTIKWPDLKDVWADQFPDEWAQARAFRLIATAHFHHDRRRDLVGCVAEHYRTLQAPNKWARNKGLFSRGALTALTVHKTRGEEHRTISNLKILTPVPTTSAVADNS